jgi:hypothetical protein
MALTFSSKGSGDSKRVSPGSHFAVCDMVVFLGLQRVEGKFTKDAIQLYIRFEVPAERWEFEQDSEKKDGPAVIGRVFTASMHRKAALRKLLESWRGKAFTDDEANCFDISTVLGVSAMLTVTENENGGKIYSNLTGISALPKGCPKVKPELPLRYYAPIDGTNTQQTPLEEFPQWIQDKVNAQLTHTGPKREIKPGPDKDGRYDFGDDVSNIDTTPVPVEAYDNVATEYSEEDIPF